MRKIISLMLLSFSFIAQATNVTKLTVAKGQGNFVVNLAANPTTGYQWKVLEYDKKLLRLKSSTYQKNSSTLVGSGGQMLFTFGIKSVSKYPNKTTINFQYARPWEKSGATKQTVEVQFK